MYKKGYDGEWKTELSELTTERDDAVKMLSDALKQNVEIDKENIALRNERNALRNRQYQFLQLTKKTVALLEKIGPQQPIIVTLYRAIDITETAIREVNILSYKKSIDSSQEVKD